MEIVISIETKYHRETVTYLKKLLKQVYQNENCVLVEDLRKYPLKIYNPSRGSTFSIDYEPDACMKKKRNNKYIIFEVLDTQNDTKTIADLIRCLFVKYCEMLIIVAKDEAHQKDVKNLVDTIVANFYSNKLMGKSEMFFIKVIFRAELVRALAYLLMKNKSKCEYCKSLFLKADSCKPTKIKIGEKIFDRISIPFITLGPDLVK